MATAKTDKSTGVQKAFVCSTVGPLLHLFTNVWFNSDPKKVELDGFVQAQLAAGKLVVVTPED